MEQTTQQTTDQGGRVVQISVSDGGVPKQPVATAHVTAAGIVGDRQRNLKYHGGPDRALCLWSLEVIQTLQHENHPIAQGSAGENVTLAGLDWASLAPGSQIQLGTEVQVEITDYAAPCQTIRHGFSDRRFSRISQTHYPGSSRLYARVLREGIVRPGDRAVVVAGLPVSMPISMPGE